jgi:8-oxo-dGTP diphosphatase
MNMSKYDPYSKNDKIYVATDCIIFGFDNGVLKLLVFERGIEPQKGAYSLIGSFVKEEESVTDAAKRVLEEITGLDNVFMEELKTYSAVERDSGYRCISIGQYALIRINDYDKELVDKHNAIWYAFDDLPPLVLDHDQMVKDALARLRRKARYQPIGLELLPEKFTLPELQSLYEAIYQKEMDSRNFRKKVLSFEVLIKLPEKNKLSSKRGAYLYKFDYDKYTVLVEKGINFEV